MYSLFVTHREKTKMNTLIADAVEHIDDLATRGGRKTLNLIQKAARRMSKETSLQRLLTILALMTAINLAIQHQPQKKDLLMATGNLAWIYSSWLQVLLAICFVYFVDRGILSYRQPEKISEAIFNGQPCRWYAWGAFLQSSIGLIPLLIGQVSHPEVVISWLLVQMIGIWATYTAYILFSGDSSSRRKRQVEQKESFIEALRRRFFAVAPNPAN